MTPVTIKKAATHKDSIKAEKVVAKKPTPEAKAKPAKAENDGASRGLTWGLKLHATIKRMLDENAKHKKTDDQLIQFMLSEFPNRENKNILYNMREMRWRYNVGELTKNDKDERVPPEVPSVAYLADGSVKEKKSKPKMSEAEKLMSAEKRKELELERRSAEIEALAKAEEKLEKLRKKITDRQAAWEAKYGVVEAKKVEPKAEEKPTGKPGKKLIVKRK